MKWLKLIVFGLGGTILIVLPVIWIPKEYHVIFSTLGGVYLFYWLFEIRN